MDFYGDNQWFMKKNVLCVWLNISILMNGDNVSTYMQLNFIELKANKLSTLKSGLVLARVPGVPGTSRISGHHPTL